MKHYILIKYHPSVTNREQLLCDISALFHGATAISGIHSVTVHPAILLSEKRYDLMICLRMEQQALAAFDASDIHRRWKQDFAPYIAHKVIFDCEG